MMGRPTIHAAVAGWSRVAAQDRALPARFSSVLDLSRWLAAFLVLIYHVRLNVLAPLDQVADPSLAVRALYLLTDCGGQAVIWFFVSSGLLVGGSVVSDVCLGRFDIRRYAVNRMSRLYVVLIPALALGYALDAVRVAHHGLSSAGEETVRSYDAVAAIANLLCLQTIAAPPLGSNLPLWSLAYEAWYYVLFPLTLAPFWARTRTGAAVALLLLVGAVAVVTRNMGLVGGFAVWLSGVAARVAPAPLMRSQPAAWLIAAAVAVAYPVFLPVFGSSAKLLAGLAFANALLTARFGANRAGLPGASWHVLLAGFSYSLYLTHAPALHILLTVLPGRSEPRLQLQPAGWLPLGIGVSLFLALAAFGYAFSRLTEAHTERVRAAVWSVLNSERASRRQP